ncbi:MAG: hypothetical protein ABI343_03680 [Burkholderiaceae bacterium]
MTYSLLLLLHLFAAFIFVGTVFFEVLILENVRKHLPRDTMRAVEVAIGNRARAIMPWTLLVLYLAGIGMASQYSAELAHPFSNRLGLLLSIKILLAISVFGHFATAMVWRKRGLLKGRRSRILHLSVFSHLVLIVLLAKSLFHPFGF